MALLLICKYWGLEGLLNWSGGRALGKLKLLVKLGGNIFNNDSHTSGLLIYREGIKYLDIVMAPSEMGAYQIIMGSGLPSKTSHGGHNVRLGPLSPCKRWAKNYHSAGVPRKKFEVQNDRVDTNSAVDTKKQKYFFIFTHGFLRILQQKMHPHTGGCSKKKTPQRRA